MLDFPGGATYGDFVERRAALTPDRVYVTLIRKDGRREELTFGDLEARTASVARAFVASGAQPGDRLLILSPNSLEMIVTMLAAARCGLVNVPVNTASVAEELAHVVGLTEPSVVVVSQRLAHLIGELRVPGWTAALAVVVGGDAASVTGARAVMSWDELEGLCARAVEIQPGRPTTDALFQLLMTSGTTGRPKAVMHSHRTRLRSAYRVTFHSRIRDSDVILNPFPLFHINCLDNALFPALICGGRAVVFEAFSATTFWETVRAEQATIVVILPTVMRAICARPESPEDRQHQVRLVLGGLRPTYDELQLFLERFAIPRYETGYGLTEAGMAVTQTLADLEPHFPSIGIPMIDRTLDLFDEAGRSVPVGGVGELVIRSIPPGGVMDGYWRDPEATSRALVDGWLHTGDLARRDEDGFFYFIGRLKDIIKRAGENIGAEEVEGVLKEHPAILDVAVIGVPDQYRDEEVMAYVVLREGHGQLTLADVRRFCDGRLAAFKIPTMMSVLEDLPRGLLGKVDKKAIRALATTVAPEQTTSGNKRDV